MIAWRKDEWREEGVMTHPQREGTICVQPNWYCFEGNLGSTIKRWGGACTSATKPFASEADTLPQSLAHSIKKAYGKVV